MDTITTLCAAEGCLELCSDANNWCRCRFTTETANFALGADTLDHVVARLIDGLISDLRQRSNGQIEGYTVTHVLSLAEEYTSLYIAIEHDTRMLLWQAAKTAPVSIIARIARTPEQCQAWAQQLAVTFRQGLPPIKRAIVSALAGGNALGIRSLWQTLPHSLIHLPDAENIRLFITSLRALDTAGLIARLPPYYTHSEERQLAPGATFCPVGLEGNLDDQDVISNYIARLSTDSMPDAPIIALTSLGTYIVAGDVWS
jgi:hypothetical protein